MNYNLVFTLLFSVSFLSAVALQKEPKTFTPWTAEQLRTADAEALHKRSQELAVLFGLSGYSEKEREIAFQNIILNTIQKPGNMEIARIIFDGTNKTK